VDLFSAVTQQKDMLSKSCYICWVVAFLEHVIFHSWNVAGLTRDRKNEMSALVRNGICQICQIQMVANLCGTFSYLNPLNIYMSACVILYIHRINVCRFYRSCLSALSWRVLMFFVCYLKMKTLIVQNIS